MIQFQEYLQSDYPGFASFIDTIIKPIFGDNFKPVTNIDDMIDCLKDDPEELEYYDEIAKSTDDSLKALAEESGLERVLKLGTIQVQGDTRPIYVYDITVSKRRQLSRNRKGIQQLIARTLNNQSGAFMLFHYGDADWEWRFSYKFVGKDKEDTTSSKRYTYLLGRDQVCKTAAQRFTNLLNKKGKIAFDDITDAFSVEKVSKEFFKKYKEHYERFCNFVYEHKADTEWFGSEFNEWEDKIIRDYVKKLLGRIVFLHFLQKKGWMGVPADKDWGEGDTEFMRNLFQNSTEEQKSNYLDQVLEPLFSDALDTNRTKQNDTFDTGVEGFRNVKIPYLNGGLFERDVLDDPKSCFPKEYFADLFEFFYEYNFTIDENDPNDAQVGVDPEMLGMIFENLLEDNKDKGAFYTPKEIVQYMCKESLIAYLQTDVGDEETKEAIRKFVTTYDVEALGGRDSELAGDIDQLLLDVKICDPAIGSGAFPMGLLKELFFCRGAISDFTNASSIKKHIIQRNIYGVDIERGAVDIARLRFWLALIVDEETPHALPNMDFKIMQGNSLLEQYKGVDLSKLVSKKSSKEGAIQLTMFENDIDVLRRELLAKINLNYNCSDHILRQSIRNNIKQTIQHQIDVQHINVNLDEIDVFGNQDFFLWHTWFADVFEKGGFDIVIGNPPYGAKLSDNDKELFKSIFSDVHMRTPETYSYFISQAIRLAKANNAIVSYIVPNNLFFQNENEKTRELLIFKNKLLRAINLGDSTFENADVPTCIFVATTGNNASYSIAYSDYREEKVSTIDWNQGIEIIDNKVLKNIPAFSLGMNLKEISILDKVKAKGISIDEIAEEMASGISTGNNKAFLMLQRKAEELDIESSIVHKILLGYEIDKFMILSDSNVIVYTPRDIAINNYPNARKWLELFKEKLQNRSESKKGILPWFSLGRARYKQLFEEPKIIMRQTSDCIRCTFDEEGYYVLNSILVFKKNTKAFDYHYITGVLNSRVTNFIYQGLTQEVGRAFAEVKPANVRKLSIPNVDIDKQKPIIKVVEDIVRMKKHNPQADTSVLEHHIDLLVYDLYGLTTEEIAIVEGINN